MRAGVVAQQAKAPNQANRNGRTSGTKSAEHSHGARSDTAKWVFCPPVWRKFNASWILGRARRVARMDAGDAHSRQDVACERAGPKIREALNLIPARFGVSFSLPTILLARQEKVGRPRSGNRSYMLFNTSPSCHWGQQPLLPGTFVPPGIPRRPALRLATLDFLGRQHERKGAQPKAEEISDSQQSH
jgi:hypothetical protein